MLYNSVKGGEFMGSIKTKEQEEILIDVTETFDYSGQSPEYISTYKKWRKNPDNPFAYNYIGNKNEITFSESEGFLKTIPEEKEREVLSRVLYIFGTVLILSLFIQFVFSKILVACLDLIGINIHNSFLNYSVYGGQKEVMAVMVTVTFLKFCLPMFIIKKTLKMPLKASLPCKLQSGKNLFFCISLSVIVSVLTSISRAYSNTTREYFNFFNCYSKEISLMNQAELVIYMFFDIVAVSIMSEFLFHGAVFQALRQFGDLYAVLICSVFSALMSNDIASMPAVLAVSAVAGISVLRSGTVFTAVAVQITNKIYLFALTIIELSFSDMNLKRGYFMVACFLISIVIAFIIWKTMDREYALKKNLSTFLTAKQKIELIFSTLPTFTVIFLCITTTITSIFI